MTRELFNNEDLISSLKNSGDKIAIYGMGNGAAKLMDVLKQNGLGCSAVFASVDFVRGQEFLGHKVLTLSQTEELLGDFTVLVGFASDQTEVISRIKKIQKKHRTLIPEINVYGVHTELFDLSYLDGHFSEFKEIYDALSDDISRRFFISLINFKLTGDPDYLWELDSLSAERTDELNVRTYADLGAYDGDTLTETLSKHPE
ncbi:MAG: hypothetical protein IJV00_01265, partial [Clostridia bacterium]|nr:hypothetical protein [Clostridia bacterium]